MLKASHVSAQSIVDVLLPLNIDVDSGIGKHANSACHSVVLAALAICKRLLSCTSVLVASKVYQRILSNLTKAAHELTADSLSQSVVFHLMAITACADSCKDYSYMPCMMALDSLFTDVARIFKNIPDTTAELQSITCAVLLVVTQALPVHPILATATAKAMTELSSAWSVLTRVLDSAVQNIKATPADPLLSPLQTSTEALKLVLKCVARMAELKSNVKYFGVASTTTTAAHLIAELLQHADKEVRLLSAQAGIAVLPYFSFSKVDNDRSEYHHNVIAGKS